MYKKKLKIALLFTLVFTPVHAQYEPEYLDSIVFKIAIYGSADNMSSWWGHASVVVENTGSGSERSFNWGDFDTSNGFLKPFFSGNLRYFASSNARNVNSHIQIDRDITDYTLNFDRKSKEIMLSYLEYNILPENNYQKYDQFRDNCATRVRDIIDLGTGGQFKAAFDSVPGHLSYRQHFSRYTWYNPLSEWLFSFFLGPKIDEKITVWDEMFLPVEIARNIIDFTYIDNSGEARNLVSSMQTVYFSKEWYPVLNKPLTNWYFFGAAGLFIMTLILLINAMRKKYPLLSRIMLGLTHCIFGLFLSVLGSLMVILLFYDYLIIEYTKLNINIWFVNPLLLLTVPFGILFIANKSCFINPEKLLRIIWTYVFVASSAAMFLRFVMPFFIQQNRSVYALIIPIAFALSYVPDFLYKLKMKYFPQL